MCLHFKDLINIVQLNSAFVDCSNPAFNELTSVQQLEITKVVTHTSVCVHQILSIQIRRCIHNVHISSVCIKIDQLTHRLFTEKINHLINCLKTSVNQVQISLTEMRFRKRHLNRTKHITFQKLIDFLITKEL